MFFPTSVEEAVALYAEGEAALVSGGTAHASRRERGGHPFARRLIALTRIAEDRFGLCIDCEELISFERLDKLPSAARCHACQEHFEARDRRPAYRKL